MNKPPFFPIATSAPTLELHDERVDLPTNRAPTLEPHDEEVELPTSTAEAQVVEGPAFLKVQGVIAIPESLQSNNSNNGHTTTIKIKEPIQYFGICFYTVFTIVWNGIMLFTINALGLVALFFPHTWIGIYLIHFIFCLLFNSTITTITSSTVNVRVTPFSAGNPSKSYALDDETVKGIRCKRESHFKGNGGTPLGGTFSHYSYEVHIAREDGSSDKVLAGLKYVAEAQFVAQEIERIMSIRDNEKTYVV